MTLTRQHIETNRRTISLLAGLCFFLSLLEYMVPKPLPFIRLGLANLPLLLALDILPFPSFMLLAGLKVTGQALISGTLFSYVFLFSLVGTGVSALLMYALRWGLGTRISFIGVGAAGAMASNAATLVLAYFFIFGESIRYAAAPILALGIVTGTLLGFFCESFTRRSFWYAGVLSGQKKTEVSPDQDETNKNPRAANNTSSEKCLERFRKAREAFCLKTFDSGDLTLAGLCMIPALLLSPVPHARVLLFLFFWLLAWLSGKKNSFLLTFIIMLGIVFFNLLVPYGELLFSFGPLRVTSGALLGGINRAVTLEGLFMLSRFCVRRDLTIPGVFGEIAGESFRIFSDLTEEKRLFKGGNWIRGLDRLLINNCLTNSCLTNDCLTNSGRNQSNEVIAKREKDRKLPGRIILIVVVILVWFPFLLSVCF